MREFTTIFWDVDGTLLDFEYAQEMALKQCLRSVNITFSKELLDCYCEINAQCWKMLEMNQLSKSELVTKRFVQLFEAFGITHVDAERFGKDYLQALGNVYEFKDDSLTICKALRTKVKQYVVTNGVSTVQRSKLKLSGLAETMDGIFISEEVGAPKPQKEFFDYCLTNVAEKDRSKILIVGDSLSSDMKGGIEAGIKTCWYRPDDAVNSTDLVPDYEISDLHFIYDILKMFG